MSQLKHTRAASPRHLCCGPARTPRRLLGIAGAIAAGVPVSAVSAQLATFEGLGNLGAPFSRARAVSADGSTAVGFSFAPGTSGRAFRWTRATGMVNLGTLSGTTLPSDAFGVSADGSVVVGNGGIAPVGFEAFRWTATTGMVGLGHLGTTPSTTANGVSADGSVVAGRSVSSAVGNEGFRWTSGTGMVGLGPFPGGGGGTNARGLSADGTVLVGVGSNAEGRTEAWRWTAATGIVGIGRLTGPPANPNAGSSSAAAISADNSTIVGVGVGQQGEAEAFKWTQATGIVGLGIPPIATHSEAYAVSGDGSIIVGEITVDPGEELTRAFIYRGEVIEVLEDVIELEYGVNLGTWWLASATGITPDGRTIVGWGYPDGDYLSEVQAWILEIAPPAPCYANCDQSTTPPVLNVSDFGCFLTRYAAGESYANCDESTQPPILNVADFGCFLTRYAAGCR